MVTVQHLLENKGNDICSISPDASVYSALMLMAEKRIGALLVLENDKLVGVISERDYARKVILKGKSSRDTIVREIMSSRVYYVSPDHRIEECMALMTDKSIRHLPVMQEDDLVGVLQFEHPELAADVDRPNLETQADAPHHVSGGDRGEERSKRQVSEPPDGPTVGVIDRTDRGHRKDGQNRPGDQVPLAGQRERHHRLDVDHV